MDRKLLHLIKMIPFLYKQINMYIHRYIEKSFEKNVHKDINNSFVWIMTEVL